MNSPASLTPGPRQTVSRVVHPHRGEGIAVKSNGPSFFQPDGGEPIAMRVDFGGWSKTGHPNDASRSWSWVTLHDPAHGEVKALVLRHGDVHIRAWHRFLGAGWLVHTERVVNEVRFDPDDAARSAIRFQWNTLRVGHPKAIAAEKAAEKEYDKRVKRGKLLPGEKPPRVSDDDAKWRTYTSRDGETMVFCRLADGEAAPAVDPYAESDAEATPESAK